MISVRGKVEIDRPEILVKLIKSPDERHAAGLTDKNWEGRAGMHTTRV